MRPIIHVVGARPQFVKAAVVLAAAPPEEDHRLLHTGQHYDARMSDVFFEELGIREPDWHLGVGSGPHGAQTGAMLEGIERVLLGCEPGVMVVYGDTNSTLAGALAAAKLHWPVAHVEAGLRSFDRRMPEEVNRVVADHLADLLLCPTPGAVEQLEKEGRPGAVHTGDVMLDLALRMAPRARAVPPEARPGICRAGAYAVATVHRPANTDDPRRLGDILGALGRAPWPVVLPLHPRTRGALERHGLSVPDRVHRVEPLGYVDFEALLLDAAHVFTDSGGVQKEAIFAATPCATLRDTTEWPETLEGGWSVLVDADPEAILKAAERTPIGPPPTAAYGGGHAARATIDALRTLA